MEVDEPNVEANDEPHPEPIPHGLPEGNPQPVAAAEPDPESEDEPGQLHLPPPIIVQDEDGVNEVRMIRVPPADEDDDEDDDNADFVIIRRRVEAALPPRRRRNRTCSFSLTCFPAQMLPATESIIESANRGGKIFLPASALAELTDARAVHPFVFKITNQDSSRFTHCGVLEFMEYEGKCFLPTWMMKNLACITEQVLRVENIVLPVATFVRLEPQSVNFLEISNPKAVLENSLRSFACLTKNDIFAIHYNDILYEFRVVETLPQDAINIIECDMEVDFAPPVGYLEPKRSSDSQVKGNPSADEIQDFFVPFSGNGTRLDGKTVDIPTCKLPGCSVRGNPDYIFEVGSLVFVRKAKPISETNILDEKDQFIAFSGTGNTLRDLTLNE